MISVAANVSCVREKFWPKFSGLCVKGLPEIIGTLRKSVYRHSSSIYTAATFCSHSWSHPRARTLLSTKPEILHAAIAELLVDIERVYQSPRMLPPCPVLAENASLDRRGTYIVLSKSSALSLHLPVADCCFCR